MFCVCYCRVVPYQIALHDGRLIFAPQDNDQLIRLRPPAAPDAPSSPVFMPRDDEEEEGEWEEEEDGAEGSGEYHNNVGDDEQQVEELESVPQKKK